MKENLKDDGMKAILSFCIIAFVLYGILNMIAMFFYAGGTAVDSAVSGYHFYQNFFSDLGMIRSYNGQLNLASALLFSAALVLMGIGLILFFRIFPRFFGQTRRTMLISRIGSVFGILSGLACAGIGLAPQDVSFTLHMIMTYCFSGTFLFAVVFLTISIFLNKTYPRLPAIVNIIYMMILTVFIALLSKGIGMHTPAGLTPLGLMILATGQKITIYSGIVCVGMQFIGAYHYAKNNWRLA